MRGNPGKSRPYYGRTVETDKCMRLEEVAAALGLSRARVHAIEQTALKKLRKALEREGLRMEDLL